MFTEMRGKARMLQDFCTRVVSGRLHSGVHRRPRRHVAPIGVCLLAGLSLIAPPAQAAFPGENGQIAFARLSQCPGGRFAPQNFEIFTIEPDGSGAANRTNTECPPNEATPPQEQQPAFSPDGKKIAYVLDNNIWVMNADGSDQRQLTFHSANDTGPAFYPDGRTIVFASERSGNFDLWRISVAPSDPVRLTTTPQHEFGAPSVSPDGTRIAFVADQTGNFDNFEIYTINADGTNRTRLTDHPAFDFAPNFSPDGTKIVFDSTRDQLPGNPNAEIYVMSADGSDETNLSNSEKDDRSPSFSPDGKKIAFASDRDPESGQGESEIYTMNADGTDQTRISTRPPRRTAETGDRDPDWGPRVAVVAPPPTNPPPTTRPPTPPPPRPCANERRGTSGHDRLIGTRAGDRLLGLSGHDILEGRAEGDCLNGGSGLDVLRGGAGADSLAGGSGSDRLDGGAGHNAYSAGSGIDSVFARNDRAENVDCGSGRDSATVDRSDRVRDCEEVRRR